MRSASVLLAMCVACDRSGHADVRSRDAPPVRPLQAVASDTLCVTSGELAAGVVDAPTFRAISPGHAGDAVSLTFRVRGATTEQRALDSGELRQQIGLKLRAQDGCNLVYVMWRFAPKPRVEVSVKRNPGIHASKECGAGGYKNIKPRARIVPVAMEAGTTHELRAEINGDALAAWIDGDIVWQGTLPATAGTLEGPAGLRSDNVAFDVIELRVDERAATTASATCAKTERSAE